MKEQDIRPPVLFNRYLELVHEDVGRYFRDHSSFVDIACPACSSPDVARHFEKDGFEYQECAACFSLYQSPRPDANTLAAFYEKAESVRFWGTEFYRQTAEARREKLFKPRAKEIAQLAERILGGAPGRFCDIGPGYGTFLEEVAKLGTFAEVTGIEPATTLAALCRDKGFEIIESTVEAMADGSPRADFITAFEVLEHVTSPFDFIAGIARLLKPSGVAVMTSLTADGFDIQTLWRDAKSVYPPHHINLLSVDGYRILLERAGLESVEITTPGKLDVDIVRNTLDETPEIAVTPFIRRLVTSGDEGSRAAFQRFLSDHNLSSHIRIIARARGKR